MTTSSLRTKSSLEIAAAAVAVVRVTMPVLLTSEFPGRASRRAEALEAGVGVWAVDWKRTLVVGGGEGISLGRGGGGGGEEGERRTQRERGAGQPGGWHGQQRCGAS